MRIVLDATPLSVSTGGISRYTSQLALSLAQEFPQDEYWLVSDQAFRFPESRPQNLHLHPEAARGFLNGRWWSFGLPRELACRNAALFHGTDFSVPYLPLRPSVMTVHDLSPWKEPRWHIGADRIRRRTPWLIGLGLAEMIITPSESVRCEVIEAFRLHPDRVVATPLAPAAHFQPVPQAPPGVPYFLYTGVLEPRKNIPMLIDAWRQVRREHSVELVLAGRRREDFPELSPEAGLRLLGEVPESDLPGLYANTVAFLFPSFYEGFGLPVLEAMACGAPVFISKDPALMEVAADAGIALGARATADWIGAMSLALEMPSWIAELREKSLRRAQQFSWTATARRTHEVYEEARRRFGV